MSDFSVRADSVDVEQIMRQIRARIRDKRGVDYTDQQIRELAEAKLERFLDPDAVRSDLLAQFKKLQASAPIRYEDALFESGKPIVRAFRRWLRPVLKLFMNVNTLTTTLQTQSEVNQLYYELIHNLVVELTKTSIELKNATMRLESLQSRLEFNERRARALEGVVQYRPESVGSRRSEVGPPPGHTEPQGGTDPVTGGESIRTRRRRRRRGRRVPVAGAAQPAGAASERDAAPDDQSEQETHEALPIARSEPESDSAGAADRTAPTIEPASAGTEPSSGGPGTNERTPSTERSGDVPQTDGPPRDEP